MKSLEKLMRILRRGTSLVREYRSKVALVLTENTDLHRKKTAFYALFWESETLLKSNNDHAMRVGRLGIGAAPRSGVDFA